MKNAKTLSRVTRSPHIRCQETAAPAVSNRRKNGCDPTRPDFIGPDRTQRGPSCEFVSFVDRNAIASAVCQDTWLLCHANANKGLNPTTAIRARGPAAARHFATHEIRLRILRTSPQPYRAHRRALCPALRHPYTCSQIRQRPFSVRLRSSQIVWDRLRSSERTAAHRPPFPQNCRNVRPIPPAKPAKERVISRQYASLRANTPMRKKPLLDIWESLTLPNTGQHILASTACIRSVLTSVRQFLCAQTAARAVAVTCVNHKNQMNCISGKCQRALETQNSRLKTQNQQDTPSRKKKIPRHLGTFGDIWGHMSHFYAKSVRTSVPQKEGSGRPQCRIYTRQRWREQPEGPGPIG